ncbi:hypothetical protein TTHERM_01311230 (macronuclear) [Tetrahymena thermophila SB210]|uniref:Transmembrane protein n=1 Tax=Tetrahymena thermophila (strain SB210) TaxID=312017 RepID=Q24F84_TETTS|nr:hypothetical protein TTHERM_01311230 [Tetrahymena thermophila SB210]EAS06440.1 hypothetical protein TTHERM_01311230 [Tetrahymena thermophila SB210]|eukprot:XP_001026685.1 hypothetical protein TTHERM_01311230 [Tetrahymena thermophila SB210]
MKKFVALLFACAVLISTVESKKKLRQNDQQDANGFTDQLLEGPKQLNSTQGVDQIAQRIVSDPNQVHALEADKDNQFFSQTKPVAIMYNNDPDFKPQLIQSNMDSSKGVTQFDSLQQECFRQCKKIGGNVFYQNKNKNYFCCQFALNNNYDGTYQQTCLTATLNC